MCASKFTFFWRRHHCRVCGLCICNDCKGRAWLLYHTTARLDLAITCPQCYPNLLHKGSPLPFPPPLTRLTLPCPGPVESGQLLEELVTLSREQSLNLRDLQPQDGFAARMRPPPFLARRLAQGPPPLPLLEAEWRRVGV